MLVDLVMMTSLQFVAVFCEVLEDTGGDCDSGQVQRGQLLTPWPCRQHTITVTCIAMYLPVPWCNVLMYLPVSWCNVLMYLPVSWCNVLMYLPMFLRAFWVSWQGDPDTSRHCSSPQPRDRILFKMASVRANYTQTYKFHIIMFSTRLLPHSLAHAHFPTVWYTPLPSQYTLQ